MAPIEIARIQPDAWRLLARAYEAGRLSGTCLYHGREGAGGWAMAVNTAALLNCEQPRKDESLGLVPCGECRDCRNVLGINHEALHIAVPLPPHKNSDEAAEMTSELLEQKRREPFSLPSGSKNRLIPIEHAREIKRRLGSKGTPGVVRVVLFYQMENMRHASADALLKMIEEPPADTIIIMTTYRPEFLLPTILSRSRMVRLAPVRPEAIKQYLCEHYELSDEKAVLLARLSDGSLGRALQMIDSDEDEASPRQTAMDLYESLFGGSGVDTVAAMQERLNSRDRGETLSILQYWQSLLRDCVDYASFADPDRLTNIDFADRLAPLARYLHGSQPAETMAAEIKMTLADMRRNVHIPGAMAALALRLRRCISLAQGSESGRDAMEYRR